MWEVGDPWMTGPDVDGARDTNVRDRTGKYPASARTE